MKPLEEIYRENFFSRRDKLDWRNPIICNAIKEVFGEDGIKSIIDVGCANGSLVRELNIRGYFAKGIEGSNNAKKYFESNDISIYDLRKKINDTSLKSRFNLVLSIEVAEHIEPEYAKQFASNIDYLVEEDGYILITAALPGQQGHYHVNCQNNSYWIDLFEKYNMNYLSKKTKAFKSYFEAWKRKKGLSFFYTNTLIFKKVIQ